MARVYRRLHERVPEFLLRRINPLEFRIRGLVRQAASQPSGARVLDAGAGEARFAGWFAEHRYVALDSGVGDGDWDYSRLHLRSDLARLPLASDSFDAVLCTQVLEHVPDPAGVVAELYRVLRPGGRLYLSAPQGWCEHQQPADYFRFTRFSLRMLLESAGFEGVQVEPMGGYFHYLGNRLAFLPRVLFDERGGWKRWALLPLELPALALFAGLLPLVCYYLDPLDRRREFTLGYGCRARKPAATEPAADASSTMQE